MTVTFGPPLPFRGRLRGDRSGERDHRREDEHDPQMTSELLQRTLSFCELSPCFA